MRGQHTESSLGPLLGRRHSVTVVEVRALSIRVARTVVGRWMWSDSWCDRSPTDGDWWLQELLSAAHVQCPGITVVGFVISLPLSWATGTWFIYTYWYLIVKLLPVLQWLGGCHWLWFLDCELSLFVILCCVYTTSISALQWLCNADKCYHNPSRRLYKFFSTLYASMVRSLSVSTVWLTGSCAKCIYAEFQLLRGQFWGFSLHGRRAA